MEIIEIGTGYTSVPARMGAATEIVVEELTKGFIANGHKVRLVDIQDPKRLPNKLPIVEVKVPSCFIGTDVALGIMHKLKRVVYSVALAKTLHSLIRQAEEPLILHFHNQYNLFFFLKLTPASLRRKVKIAYTVHSYIWPKEWKDIHETIKKRYFQEVFCVRNADYVLVLNDKTKEHFIERLGVKSEKIHKIKNGVNPEVYRPLTTEENETFKESIGLKGKRYFFQVGSVCDRKNQLDAVKAIAEYLGKHDDTAYIFAGGIIDQAYFDEIMAFAREKGIEEQVCYAGELQPGKELNRYYSGANAVVFPSKLESFGLVIIEALSAGTTVILRERPLFPIENGFCVCADEEQFSEMAAKFIENKKIETAARNEAIDKYGWNTVAWEHAAVFCPSK